MNGLANNSINGQKRSNATATKSSIYNGKNNGGAGGGGTGRQQTPGGKKTKGRVKIKMEFIDNKLRRYTTFSKRKTGIMKKVCLGNTWSPTGWIRTCAMIID